MPAVVRTLWVVLALSTAAHGDITSYEWDSTWNTDEMENQFQANENGDSRDMTSQESSDIKNILEVIEYNNRKRVQNIVSMLLQNSAENRSADYLSQSARSLETTTVQNSYSESENLSSSKSGMLAVLTPFQQKQEFKGNLTTDHDENVESITTKGDHEPKEDIDLRETQYESFEKKQNTVILPVIGGTRSATHYRSKEVDDIPEGFEMQSIYHRHIIPRRGKRSITDLITRNVTSEQHKSDLQKPKDSAIKRNESHVDDVSVEENANTTDVPSTGKSPAARYVSVNEISSTASPENIRKCSSSECKRTNEQVNNLGNKGSDMKTRDRFDEDWAYIPDETEKASKDEISLTILGKIRQVSGKPIKLQYNLEVNHNENSGTGNNSGVGHGVHQHSEPDDEQQVSELGDTSEQSGGSGRVDPFWNGSEVADYHDPDMENDQRGDLEIVDPIRTDTYDPDYHYPEMENDDSSSSEREDPLDYHDPLLEDENNSGSGRVDPLRTGTYDADYQYPQVENAHTSSLGRDDPLVTDAHYQNYHYPQMENEYSDGPGLMDPLKTDTYNPDYHFPQMENEQSGGPVREEPLQIGSHDHDYHDDHMESENSGSSEQVDPFTIDTYDPDYHHPHMESEYNIGSGQVDPLTAGTQDLGYQYPQMEDLQSYPRPLGTVTDQSEKIPVTTKDADGELYDFNPYYQIGSTLVQSSAQSLTSPEVSIDPIEFGIQRLLEASVTRQLNFMRQNPVSSLTLEQSEQTNDHRGDDQDQGGNGYGVNTGWCPCTDVTNLQAVSRLWTRENSVPNCCLGITGLKASWPTQRWP